MSWWVWVLLGLLIGLPVLGTVWFLYLVWRESREVDREIQRVRADIERGAARTDGNIV